MMRRLNTLTTQAAANKDLLLRGWTSATRRDATTVILGNTALGVRSSNASDTVMSDIAHSTQSMKSGFSNQLAAGDILGAMDVCAANVAQMHCTGTRRFGRDSSGNAATSVCTVAVDQTPFKKPVMNGDMVMVEGRAIHAGSSSIGVAVEVSRLQFPTREKRQVCHSFFTMVAIDEKLKKAQVVPALELSTERDIALNEQYLASLAMGRKAPQERLRCVIESATSALNESSGGCSGGSSSSSLFSKKGSADVERIIAEAKTFLSVKSTSAGAATAATTPTASLLECAPNTTKRTKIPFEETRTEANRVFFPQYLNMNYTIFGGELMRWMEAHALQCGRMFTANRDIRSIGMYNVTFSDAIGVQDWVTLNTHVVYVHHTTMEVEVEIAVERSDKKVVTNRASFVLANFDEAGQLMEIRNGLELSGASEDWLARYADGRARYEIGRLSRVCGERNAFSLPRK